MRKPLLFKLFALVVGLSCAIIFTTHDFKKNGSTIYLVTGDSHICVK